MIQTRGLSIVTGLILSVCSGANSEREIAPAPLFRALVFTKTAGFRHSSIDEGILAIQTLGTANNFAVEATEDPFHFNSANLSNYGVVIFLNTTGDVLDASQQTSFANYIQSGTGFVGIHSATDTEYTWAWYGGLVGAYFQSHPAIQQATLIVEDAHHLSTEELPSNWVRTDEWYNFQTNPRTAVNVLIRIDEASYGGGTMGSDHPIAWYHLYDGGRAWYTALGHTEGTYSEPLFLDHLLGGILWAAGVSPDPAAETSTWYLYD